MQKLIIFKERFILKLEDRRLHGYYIVQNLCQNDPTLLENQPVEKYKFMSF